MQALAKLEHVNSLWAGPISGDGSLAIGAAWAACKKFSEDKILGLTSIYLGSKMSKNEVETELNKYRNKYHIIDRYSPEDVANWINEGNVVQDVKEKWNLDNVLLGTDQYCRSEKTETVERINKKIKYRDFWMPFTPTICHDSCKITSIIKKCIFPYMTMAFDLKPGLA